MTVEDVTATLSQQGIAVGKGRRVRFDRSEAREFMRRWTNRGQVLRAEQLQWTPYGRGKDTEGPGGRPGGVEGVSQQVCI